MVGRTNIIATLVAALSTVSAAAAVPAAGCWEGASGTAARMHAFETMLKVGALKCRDESPETVENFNRFIRGRGDMVAGHSFVIRAQFVSQLGMAKGEEAFANYESALANHYSGVSKDVESCAKIAAYARLASKASENDLAQLASAVAAQPDNLCIPASNRLALREDGDGDTVDAPAGTAVNGAKPAVIVEAEQAPVLSKASVLSKGSEKAVIAQSSAAPPQISAADALADAARALAAAATVLQAQQKDTTP